MLMTGVGLRTATAQDAAAFYKGKTVKMIVGYGPGGGYDLYARMFVPYLEKALGATVVVENQPGAGGLSALNRLYVAQPDGLQMMIVNGTAAGMSQLVGQAAVKYDLGKVDHLGTVSASPWVWLVRQGMTEKTPADFIKNKPLIRWGASGLIDGLSDGAAVTCEALALPCKIVKGYKGSNDVALALTRSEMDGLYISDPSAATYVASGNAVAVATMAHKRSQYFKDLPTIFEALPLNADQTWWFDFRATLEALGRILVTTPGVPADRVAYLRQAVAKVLTDPAVIAEGEKTQRTIGYVDAEATRKAAIAVVSATTPEQKQRIKQTVLEKYQ
jgi:tripartite-type tricarboxylate transporter receptor subunit TctC